MNMTIVLLVLVKQLPKRRALGLQTHVYDSSNYFQMLL